MDSDASDNIDYYEGEIDDKSHEKLVENVLNLHKSQRLKKPSRTEPSLQISEFNLVNSLTGDAGQVNLNELTAVLNNRKNHVAISKKVLKTSKKATTLPKPLEKPQADRIKRAVGYEKTRLKLDRWEPIVTSNRAAPNLLFPLSSNSEIKLEKKEREEITKTWRLKSQLEKDLEKLNNTPPVVEEYHIEVKDKFPLNLTELMEKRKEFAKLRAHQSYKEAKARRQNKIKSKKFHRIERRQKLKKQLKEFEQLQKTDPEEALKKLEDIDRARVEERFNLRHRSTGQWARSKLVRAKYDKETRQELSQQLAISRDLTQKLKAAHNSDESDDDAAEKPENRINTKSDPTNPWINGVKTDKEVADFVSSYRKFWDETNNQNNNNTEQNNTEAKEESTSNESSTNVVIVEEKMPEPEPNSPTSTKKKRKKVTQEKTNSTVKKINNNKNNNESLMNDSIGTSADWDVTIVESEDIAEDIETVFNKLENKLSKKIKKKAKYLKKTLENDSSNKHKDNKPIKNNKKYIPDLTLPASKNKKPIIDEPLSEQTNDNENIVYNSDLNKLKNIIEAPEINKKKQQKTDIDPLNIIKVKPTNLKTAIPDISSRGENDDDEQEINDDQRQLICEAFEDDDLVNDFNKDKSDEIDKNKPKDVNLTLPGWGSWGGTNIKPSKRKQKRFIIKMPKQIPRKDDNKGSLILNESGNTKIKEHLVSELPFPFKTVKDYEASMRAPIGSTFVPETAFRRLTKPALRTKIGTIIEPMSKSVLLKKKK